MFDVRGKDLLAVNNAAYDFSGIKGDSKGKLHEVIDTAEVVALIYLIRLSQGG